MADQDARVPSTTDEYTLTYYDQLVQIDVDGSWDSKTTSTTTGTPPAAPTRRHQPGSRTVQFRPGRVVPVRESTALAWRRYLDDLSSPPVRLGPAYARAVRRVWSSLVETAGVPIRPPAAGPGGELGFHFSWQTADRGVVVDIDIAPDGTFEWYWRDRVADDDDGSEDEHLREPPERLVALLVRHFRIQ